MKWYCDGFILPNGGGFAIVDENNFLRARGVCMREITNNEAELRGILNTLILADRGDTVSSDSACCIWWVRKGKSKVRKDLIPLMQEANRIMQEKAILLIWEGRDDNLAGHWNERMHARRDKARKRGDVSMDFLYPEKKHALKKIEIEKAKAEREKPDPKKPWRSSILKPTVRDTLPEVAKVERPTVVYRDRTEAEYTRDALMKEREGVPKSSMTITEQVALEVHHF